MTRQLVLAVTLAATLLLNAAALGSSNAWHLTHVESVQLIEGGSAVSVILAPNEALQPPSVGDQQFIEFSIPEGDPDSVVTFEAYLLDPETVPETVAEWIPISSWEITPRDHEVGLGGYVRLYLPDAVLESENPGGSIAILIRSADCSQEDLTASLQAIALTVPGAE